MGGLEAKGGFPIYKGFKSRNHCKAPTGSAASARFRSEGRGAPLSALSAGASDAQPGDAAQAE